MDFMKSGGFHSRLHEIRQISQNPPDFMKMPNSERPIARNGNAYVSIELKEL